MRVAKARAVQVVADWLNVIFRVEYNGIGIAKNRCRIRGMEQDSAQAKNMDRINCMPGSQTG